MTSHEVAAENSTDRKVGGCPSQDARGPKARHTDTGVADVRAVEREIFQRSESFEMDKVGIRDAYERMFQSFQIQKATNVFHPLTVQTVASTSPGQ